MMGCCRISHRSPSTAARLRSFASPRSPRSGTALVSRCHAPSRPLPAVTTGSRTRCASPNRIAPCGVSTSWVVGLLSGQRSTAAAEARGVRVAQVHLGAVLDPDLLRSGVGDTGGIATLLVRLGVALARTPDIAEVVTIGRGTARDVLDVAGQPVDGPRFAPVALEPEAGTAFGDPWPARISAERGLQRVIRRPRPAGRHPPADGRRRHPGRGKCGRDVGDPHRVQPRARPARPHRQPRSVRRSRPKELRHGRRDTPPVVSRPPRRAPGTAGRPCGALSA